VVRYAGDPMHVAHRHCMLHTVIPTTANFWQRSPVPFAVAVHRIGGIQCVRLRPGRPCAFTTSRLSTEG
jgi:hypothetical protein